MKQQLFTMGQVAKRLGVTKNTLARWEDKGLIPKPRRDHNDHRVYTGELVAQIEKLRPVQQSALYLAKQKTENVTEQDADTPR